MSNGDKAKGSDYLELLLVSIAGAFGGIVKAVINNGNGTSPPSMEDTYVYMRAAAIGLGAALIFVGTLPLLLSIFLPLSGLKDLIKRDRRLLIALALISGFIGEPIWTGTRDKVVPLVKDVVKQISQAVSLDSTEEENGDPPPTNKDAEQPPTGPKSSGNSPEQEPGRDSTAVNGASENASESESSENEGGGGTPRFSNERKDSTPPRDSDFERPLDAGKEGGPETTEVRDPASPAITNPQIAGDSGRGRTRRIPVTEEDVPGYSSGLKIIEKKFCLEMDRPECKTCADSENISLSKIKTIENNVPQLYFWTLIEATEDLEIMHVWSSSNRSDKWAERIHVSTGTQFPNLMREMRMHKVREYLIKNMNTNWHSNQAVLLALQRSDQFRTYSSIKAIPGRYTVEVRYLGSEKIVLGGEAKTIIIDPSH